MRPIALVVVSFACGAASCGDGGDPVREVGLPDWWDTRTYPDTGEADTGGHDTRPDDTREADVPDAPPLLDDGAPCGDGAECAGGECLPAVAWPGGYCTTRLCEADDECASETSLCATLNATRLCAVPCAADEECREGYWCAPTDGGGPRVCAPGSAPAADGEPCAEDRDCAGGTCLRDFDWPGGYCTTRHCETREDCARDDGTVDNRCLIQRPANYCVRMCATSDECRADEGYTCQPIGSGEGVCVPTSSEPPRRDIDFTTYPFDVQCGLAATAGELVVDYVVAADTTAYMLVPIARDGARVQPVRIELPDGGTIEMDGDNAFQLAPSLLLGHLNPFVVPATADLASQLQAGEHRLVLSTTSANLCWYLLEEQVAGDTIDLNLYLVGVPDLDAASAATDARIATMLETFDAVYASTGVALGEIRFIDASTEVAEAYQVIRDEQDLLELVESSDLPGEGADAALSVNVFLTRAISGDLAGVLGISLGLPGAAGAHGTRSAGVVVTTEYLDGDIPGEGPGTVYTGIVLAHEVGHYVGLFHTSEAFGAGFDPLSDTPRCTRDFPAGCPDLGNLMFPFAASDHTVLTEGQAWQIRVNPLTKPAVP